MVRNGALDEEREKIAPAPATAISVSGVRQAFPKVVEKDFVREGRIYALPTSIDTLALIYNRTYLNQRAVVFPPRTWEEVQGVVPKLTEYGAGRRIKKSAAAVGGSTNTIDRAGDLLALIQAQYGEGEALEIMRSFQDPSISTYTWNEEMPYSLDAFAGGLVGMVFNYQSSLQKIRKKNSILDIQIAGIPQKEGEENNSKAIARYWGYTVSRQSAAKNIAWEFVLQLTTNALFAGDYMAQSGNAPALNILIQQKLNDPDLGVFARQALIADSITERETRTRESELLNSL